MSTKRILCSLVCVGGMSWTTTYQDYLAPSNVLVLWRLVHTLAHSIPGWSCITHTSHGVHSDVYIIRRVPHTHFLNALCESSCFLGAIYAHSIAQMPMYYNFRGIARMFGGFPLGARLSHTWSHAPVSFTLSPPGPSTWLERVYGIWQHCRSGPGLLSRSGVAVLIAALAESHPTKCARIWPLPVVIHALSRLRRPVLYAIFWRGSRCAHSGCFT